jgi:hypothetical protein
MHNYCEWTDLSYGNVDFRSDGSFSLALYYETYVCSGPQCQSTFQSTCEGSVDGEFSEEGGEIELSSELDLIRGYVDPDLSLVVIDSLAISGCGIGSWYMRGARFEGRTD